MATSIVTSSFSSGMYVHMNGNVWHGSAACCPVNRSQPPNFLLNTDAEKVENRVQPVVDLCF